MNCPNCSHKMTVLFTSVVCDRCNPPQLAGDAREQQVGQNPVLWISLSGNAREIFAKNKLLVYPRPTRLDAERVAKIEQPNTEGHQLYRVFYAGPLKDVDYIHAAYACESETVAKHRWMTGHNAVWLYTP